MSNQAYVVEQQYTLRAGADLVLVSTFGDVQLVAASSDGNAVIQGPSSVTMNSGPASVYLAGTSPESGSVVIECGIEGTVTVASGPAVVGPTLVMSPETITLRVGASMIEMTPESITLMVGDATYTLTAEGIVETVAECTRELTAEGHNLTAAETEFNVGVEGEAKEGPTKTEEVEAGSVENETLAAEATDAVKNEDAAVMITE